MYTRNGALVSNLFIVISGSVLCGVLLVLTASRISPLLIFFCFLGLPIVIAIFKNPTLGLMIIAAVVPIERLGRITGDSVLFTFSLMRIVGLLTLFSFIVYALIKKKKFIFGVPFFLFFAFWLLGVLTWFYTNDLESAIRFSGSMLGSLLFFFLVINIARSWKIAKAVIIVWLSVSVLIGVYTVYDWHIGQNRIDESRIGNTEQRLSTVWSDASEWESLEAVSRAMGPTSHAAVYGINLILTLPFFAYLLRTKLSWFMKGVVILGSLIIIYNVLLTNTRAAILLAAFIIGLCAIRKLLVIRLSGLVAGVLLLTLMIPFVPDSVHQRVLNISNYTFKESGTLRIRMDYWTAGLEVAEKNWFKGL